jgi:hypothetical protein
VPTPFDLSLIVAEGNHPHAAYVVVFDIANTGYKSFSLPAFGLIFIAVGIFLVLIRRSIPGWSERPPWARLVFPWGFLCFAILWTLCAFVVTYGEYRAASSARQNNSAKVVEGIVTDFRPMPATGHSIETFCVSGVCFSYSDYIITSGFNQTSSHGGPIREGLPVRVTYVGDTIVKLEIAK